MAFTETTFINEFSEVRVTVVQTRTGNVLELHAPRIGTTVRLDTFALELLTRLDPAALSDYVQDAYQAPEQPGDGAIP